MAGKISVSVVQRNDYDQWRLLWDAYNAFYGRTGKSALSPEITAATWARLLKFNEPMHAVIAKDQGCIVGFAHYLFHRSTTSLAPNCYLQDLYTSECQRGQGVGRALIDHVFQCAVQAGSTEIYWQTHRTNVPAMRLYDTLAEQSEFLIYCKTR